MSEPTKFAFTERELEKRSRGQRPGSRVDLYDATADGLIARVYRKRSGDASITFYWRRHRHGQRTKLKRLGKRSSVYTLKAAQSEVHQRNGHLEAGKIDVVAKRHVPTLDDAYQTFRAHALLGRVTGRSLEGYDWLATLWGSLGRAPVNRIRPADVKALHARLGSETKRRGKPQHRTANRVVQLLSRVWEACADDGDVDGRNPCHGVRRFPERPRDRVLSADELARFFEALHAESVGVRDLFTVLAFTGARVGNVCAMKFRDIDFEATLWTVPASEAKSRKAIRIPLTDTVVQLLRRRRLAVMGDYVFPSREGSKSPHVWRPKGAFERVAARAGITGASPHSLRKSWASIALESGAQQRTISDGLGHGDLSSIEAYAFSTPASVRDAAERVAERLRQSCALPADSISS